MGKKGERNKERNGMERVWRRRWRKGDGEV